MGPGPSRKGNFLVAHSTELVNAWITLNMETETGMQMKVVFVKVIRYIGRLLLYSIGASFIACLSFLFTGGLNTVSLSERVFWAGMAVMMVSVVLVIAIASVGTGIGLPGMIRKPEEARQLMDKHFELRSALEKRYDLCILLCLAGMCCVGISALIQTYSPWK